MRFASLTIAASAVLAASSAHAVTMWGIDQHNVLFRFDTALPSVLQTAHTLRLPSHQEAVAIDFRPSDQKLYVMTEEGDIFSVNTTAPSPANYWEISGEGGRVSNLDGTSFGFDFNPVTDRLRVTSDTGVNLEYTMNGATSVQTPLSVPGRVPAIVGSAYSNNFAGAGATTLYNIDASGTSTNQDWLTVQNPQQSGVQTVIGPLGEVVTAEEVGFDIAPNNVAYLAANSNINDTPLFTVNLSTGTASYVGTIGSGFVVRDIAVAIPEPVVAELAVFVGIVLRRRGR